MRNVKVKRNRVNIEKLQEELDAICNNCAVSTGRGYVTVHVMDSLTQDAFTVMETEIKAVVLRHDANQLTAAQQKEIDDAKRIDELFSEEFNIDNYKDADPLIQILAQRVLALEMTIRQLRGE